MMEIDYIDDKRRFGVVFGLKIVFKRMKVFF